MGASVGSLPVDRLVGSLPGGYWQAARDRKFTHACHCLRLVKSAIVAIRGTVPILSIVSGKCFI